MRLMADSIDASSLPATGYDLYAGYVDGKYQSYLPAVARFGIEKVVPIAVFSSTDMGTVGDCENGDLTPQTCVSWVVMRRAKGVDPTIYCSVDTWAAVQQAFNDARVPQPHYWIAAYPGNGPNLYPGSVAHQYADTGPNGENIDVSVIADFWPGVDSTPTPQPSGEPMAVSNIISFKPGQLDLFQVSLNTLWHKWCIGGVWGNEPINTPGGANGASGQPQVSIEGGACYVTVEDGAGKVWGAVQAQNAGTWAIYGPLP